MIDVLVVAVASGAAALAGAAAWVAGRRRRRSEPAPGITLADGLVARFELIAPERAIFIARNPTERALRLPGKLRLEAMRDGRIAARASFDVAGNVDPGRSVEVGFNPLTSLGLGSGAWALRVWLDREGFEPADLGSQALFVGPWPIDA